MMEQASIQLPTGTLHYEGAAGNPRALTTLCDFGARRNRRRGFVFISKVLGKHWPAAPDAMQGIHRQLAGDIPLHDDKPVVFIGMAETATGLGHGVFEAFLERPGAHGLYLQTTRYLLDGARSVDFREEHSHAVEQILYLPEDPHLLQALQRASTVVLVDDEATSGRTLRNLAIALRSACPNLVHLVPLVVTDFSQGRSAAQLQALDGVHSVTGVAAWRGRYQFDADDSKLAEPAESAVGRVGCRRAHCSPYTARLGLDRAIELPPALIAACETQIGARDVLVVGTGECMHPAFRLGLALQKPGRQVRVQSTTRSPLMVAHGIRDAQRVTDPYGEQVPNFLYNRGMSAGAQVVLVHETLERSSVAELIAQLDAIEVSLTEALVRPAAKAAGSRVVA